MKKPASEAGFAELFVAYRVIASFGSANWRLFSVA
jgi:hypothetical protein